MPKRILHAISESGPTAKQSDAANRSRAEGNVYLFMSESWALKNDAMDCDELITDSAALKKKYKFD